MMYQLYYWPMLPGRGEFVRLVLAAAGAEWDDVARRNREAGGGVAAILALRRGDVGAGLWPYAPPALGVDGQLLGQTAAICDFLAARHGLVPTFELPRGQALALSLTIADVVSEVHDTHHPISVALTYEEQVDAAVECSRAFRETRLPKLLGYFEAVVARHGQGDHLLASGPSYVDLLVFQLMAGLDYAFPRAMKALGGDVRRLRRVAGAASAQPRVAAYLASSRRIAFNNHGIFRQYPELDAP